eukprot:GEZU01011753.1.p1 GENE.GEZU01011753.1~~GEZU01011753.1.p1  ORF type:complete len:119 (-),score=27.90 GEZU01011753.1:510-866(-)
MNVTELRADLEEFERLLSTATRKKVKTVLSNEIASLQSKISTLEAQGGNQPIGVKPVSTTPAVQQPAAAAAADANAPVDHETRFKTAQYANITSFAWDQSEHDVTYASKILIISRTVI